MERLAILLEQDECWINRAAGAQGLPTEVSSADSRLGRFCVSSRSGGATARMTIGGRSDPKMRT